MSNNFNYIMQLVRGFSGQGQILTIPRVFIDFVDGDIETALFLSQVIFWSDKGQSEWFYKTYADWESCLGLSEYKVRKAAKRLTDMGFLQTAVKKANGNPTVHYYLDVEAFSDSFLKFFQERNPKNFGNETQKISGTKPKKLREPLCITEITTETTTDIKSARKHETKNGGSISEFEAEPKKSDRTAKRSRSTVTNFETTDKKSDGADQNFLSEKQVRTPPSSAAPPSSQIAVFDSTSALPSALEYESTPCTISIDSKGKKSPSIDYGIFQRLWNDGKPSHWAECSVLNTARVQKLKRFVSDCGGLEEAIQIFRAGLEYARTDQWCQKADTNLAIENYLTNNKPQQWAEKSQAGGGDYWAQKYAQTLAHLEEKYGADE